MDRRVLVVDDDPAMLKLLSKYLSAAGFEVLAASGGEEALGILHREGPPILLSDWSMPGMDGLQLCQAVRASEALGFIYIIMVTAHAEKDRVVQALEAGANDFLAKPFHHQELLARINAGMRIIALEADLNRQKRELHLANAELSILNRKLEQMATTDELTGLANRREGMERLKAMWAFSVRHGQPLSVVMIDMDYFKRCNDTYGHDAGDEILKDTAAVFKRLARAGDVVCRWGGEEFLMLCPNATGPMAVTAADRLREHVANNRIAVGRHELSITISAGVAERCPAIENAEDLLKLADEALYEAKQQGRNRVLHLQEANIDATDCGSADPADPPDEAGVVSAAAVARQP